MTIYKKSPQQELLAAVNEKHPDAPLPISYNTVYIENLLPITEQLAQATIAGIQYSGYRGSTDVEYHRLDLGVLFAGLQVEVRRYQPNKLEKVLQAIALRYGIPIEVTDLEPVPPSAMATTPYTLRLRAHADSVRYRGEFEVHVDDAFPSLREILPMRELSVLVDRFPLQPGILQVDRTYYKCDFSGYGTPTLQGIAVGWEMGIVSHPFATILNHAETRAQVGDIWWGWGSSGMAYNLAYTRCVYNGPAAGHPDANPKYDRVLIATLGGLSVGQSGRFLMHYNL